LTIAWPAFLVLAGSFLVITKKDLRRATSIANVISVVMAAIPLMTIVIFELTTTSGRTHGVGNEASNPQFEEAENKAVSKPDIFFIVLDAYARRDVLQTVYGYDNREFLDYLTANGFYIAEESFSNYNQTGLSLASCLNLTYLDEIAQRVGTEVYDHGPLRQLIKHGNVQSFLRKNGYTIVAFASGQAETEMETADVYITIGQNIDPFQNLLINSTPIPYLLGFIKVRNLFDVHREKLLYILDHLGDVQRVNRSPKFVFAHIEAPHPPFVFGPNGEKRYPEKQFHDRDGNHLIGPGGMTKAEYHRAYRDQLIFVSKRIRDSLDKIIAGASTPPIIILLGDHGPRSGLNWEDPMKTDHRESMGILNAYLLPDNGREILYGDISPVNTFRIIFDRYFGTRLGVLEDKVFYSTASKPYHFYDVTDAVRAVH
jgi:hypothetical protein